MTQQSRDVAIHPELHVLGNHSNINLSYRSRPTKNQIMMNIEEPEDAIASAVRGTKYADSNVVRAHIGLEST